MKKFSALVKAEIELAVMVDAEHSSEAEELALETVQQKLRGALGPGGFLLFAHDFVEVPEESGGEVKTETYVCDYCGEISPKRMWGPGWVTCPRCNEIALALHRTAALKAALDAISVD